MKIFAINSRTRDVISKIFQIFYFAPWWPMRWFFWFEIGIKIISKLKASKWCIAWPLFIINWKMVILTTKSFIGSKYGFLWRYIVSYTYLESALSVLQNELLHWLENLYFTEKATWRIGRIPYPSQSRDLSTDNKFKTWFVHSFFSYWSVWAQWGE